MMSGKKFPFWIGVARALFHPKADCFILFLVYFKAGVFPFHLFFLVNLTGSFSPSPKPEPQSIFLDEKAFFDYLGLLEF